MSQCRPGGQKDNVTTLGRHFLLPHTLWTNSITSLQMLVGKARMNCERLEDNSTFWLTVANSWVYRVVKFKNQIKVCLFILFLKRLKNIYVYIYMQYMYIIYMLNLHVFSYIHTDIYVCMCIYTYIFIYIYISLNKKCEQLI